MRGPGRRVLEGASLCVIGVGAFAAGVTLFIRSQFLSVACDPDVSVSGSCSTFLRVSASGELLVLTGLVMSIVGAMRVLRLMPAVRVWLVMLIPCIWWLVTLIGEYFDDIANERTGGLETLVAGVIPVWVWLLAFLVWTVRKGASRVVR